MQKLSVSKKHTILLLCWCAYALAYTLRVNISVVIPSLRDSMNYTNTQLGTVTSLFFITYTVGQLINGYLGDKLDSKFLIISGLFLSSVFNICIGLSNSLIAIGIFWALNGIVQSMLWGPIVKALSMWFDSKELTRVSFIMSLCMIFGYALSWGGSSLLSNYFNWRYVFLCPAGLVLIYTFVMLIFFKSAPQHDSDNIQTPIEQDKKDGNKEHPTLWEFFRIIHLPFLFVVSMTQGIIREGISVWLPTILQDYVFFSENSIWRVLILVPFINLCGIIFIRHANYKFNLDNFRTLQFTFTLLATAAITLVLIPAHWSTVILVVMVLLLSMTYGLTPILTSGIPFQFSRYKWVSLTAGVLDFSIYLGAALSGVVSGFIADNFQWSGVMILWLLAAIVGLLASFYLNKIQNTKPEC